MQINLTVLINTQIIAPSVTSSQTAWRLLVNNYIKVNKIT